MGIEPQLDCWGRPLSDRVRRLEIWLDGAHQVIEEIGVHSCTLDVHLLVQYCKYAVACVVTCSSKGSKNVPAKQEVEGNKAALSQLIQRAEDLLQQGKKGLGMDPSELPRGFDKELAKLQACLNIICHESSDLLETAQFYLLSRALSLHLIPVVFPSKMHLLAITCSNSQCRERKRFVNKFMFGKTSLRRVCAGSLQALLPLPAAI